MDAISAFKSEASFGETGGVDGGGAGAGAGLGTVEENGVLPRAAGEAGIEVDGAGARVEAGGVKVVTSPRDLDSPINAPAEPPMITKTNMSGQITAITDSTTPAMAIPFGVFLEMARIRPIMPRIKPIAAGTMASMPPMHGTNDMTIAMIPRTSAAMASPDDARLGSCGVWAGG
jgi:hypothetical protein